MTSQHYTATVYEPDPSVDRVEALTAALSSAGFTDVSVEEQPLRGGGTSPEITASHPTTADAVTITPFQRDSASDEDDPLEISAIFHENVRLSSWERDAEYASFLDACVDLVREIAARLDPEYVALFWVEDWERVNPGGSPLADHVTVPPEVGVYSESLRTDLDGLKSLYDSVSVRREETDSDHEIVVRSDGPWSETAWGDVHNWAEPRRADIPLDGVTDLSDPLGSLEPGECGTDVVISRPNGSPTFSNEALTLEWCYRDESDALRRVADDSFVRRVVGDDGPVGELPADADPDDERVSALIQGSIPTAFVRSSGPNDETIVSTVMALDMETSKFDLLVRLAKVARVDNVDDDIVATIAEMVTKLGEMDDQDGIDAYIQRKIL
ncbi:hypothetical protein [Halomicrobium salinisoli]|uniref:hypothetical protein n=1 Tax=Halomicrobium salinisoli TaxID=2878391 RepID=UPI001CF021D6|nr:hypothetical protein [Halomicrobium salinisoli]